MSRFPPKLEVVYAVIGTAAAAGGLNTTMVLAAPGAGQRIRVWALDVTWVQNSTGDLFGHVWESGASRAASYAISDESRADHVVVPGGLALSENVALHDESRASGVSQQYRLRASYTVEDV